MIVIGLILEDLGTVDFFFFFFPFPQKGEIILSSNVKFSAGSDGSLYVVSPGGEETGEYVCTATNAAGYATRKVQLTVYGMCELKSNTMASSFSLHCILLQVVKPTQGRCELGYPQCKQDLNWSLISALGFVLDHWICIVGNFTNGWYWKAYPSAVTILLKPPDTCSPWVHGLRSWADHNFIFCGSE